jgi:hypothetical protein
MAIYLIVHKSTGAIRNAVEWDGITPYAPPEGDSLELIHYPAGASSGWTWNAGRAVDPNPPEETETVQPAENGGMAVDP